MCNLRTRTTFDYKDFCITAQAMVLNSSLVTQLDLYFHDLDEEFWPTGELLEEIEDAANELLLDENMSPELNF